MTGYEYIQQQEAYGFYQNWISKDFPRYVIIEIQHQNPYYDDSYAVNSANLGPYGDAIMEELIFEVEKRFNCVGEGWGRFTYGGSTIEEQNLLEYVLGTHSRSGGQWDIWQAVYSPQGKDGYPKPIWDKLSGVIDPEVAEYWYENYDLKHIMERDWPVIGPKLEEKIHIYCGDMDTYYLNNAVKLMQEFLESTRQPYYDGEVAFGDGFEHCWNGDPNVSNAISRLRYNWMYNDKIRERLQRTAPKNHHLVNWGL